MDVRELCNRETQLTYHLKQTCPDYIDAIRVVAYWIALATEASSAPNASWEQFQKQVDTFRAKIKELTDTKLKES